MNQLKKIYSVSIAMVIATILSLVGCAIEEPVNFTTATESGRDDGSHQGEQSSDSIAPTAVSLLINNGATFTSSNPVNLQMVATDDVAVTHYYASESAETPQPGDNGWNSYQQSTPFTLVFSPSLGVFSRTVYVWFKDAAGNVSNSINASISWGVFDTTAPTVVSMLIDNGADNTTSSSVTLRLSATDDQAVTGYYASESATNPLAGDSGWDNFSTSVSYSFDNATAGTKTINVWFKDAAGNISGRVVDTIELQSGSITGERISSGSHFNCVVKPDGTVQCWGGNYGQSTVPSDLGTVSSISTEQDHTCAIKTDGTVQCWGSNGYGESTVPSDLGTVSSLSLGNFHTCAIKTDGTVQCWGNNINGQINVPSDLGTVSSIGSGKDHTCAIKTDGIVQCWGSNGYGESTVPSDLGTVNNISIGLYRNCAMKTNGMVQCWGYNHFGQSAVPSDLGTVSSIGCGSQHTCAMKTNGTVQCWGRDYVDQISVPSNFQ
mgnify:CR=1 FL=1